MDDFLPSVKRFVAYVPFMRDMVAIYHCMIDDKTPFYVKGTIAGALAYFLLPTDAIPDILTGIGFTDDATVIATTLATVRAHVKEEHWRLADEFLNS